MKAWLIYLSGWIGVLLACGASTWSSRAAEVSSGLPATPPVEALDPIPSIVLEDQFERNHAYRFPLARPMVLLVADKKGHESLAPWIEAVREHAGHDVLIVGIADLRGVPGFLHGKVRRKFRTAQKHPILLDWNGAVLNRLEPEKGTPNAYLIGAGGNVLYRLHGEATAANVERLKERFEAISSANREASLPVRTAKSAR